MLVKCYLLNYLLFQIGHLLYAAYSINDYVHVVKPVIFFTYFEIREMHTRYQIEQILIRNVHFVLVDMIQVLLIQIIQYLNIITNVMHTAIEVRMLLGPNPWDTGETDGIALNEKDLAQDHVTGRKKDIHDRGHVQEDALVQEVLVRIQEVVLALIQDLGNVKEEVDHELILVQELAVVVKIKNVHVNLHIVQTVVEVQVKRKLEMTLKYQILLLIGQI